MSKTLPIAVQVYSVREEAERDFAGTMKKLGEMGYDGVELAGLYGKSAEEIRDSIKAAGLTAISAHVSYDELAGDLEKTLQDYETIGCRYIVIPWLGEDRRFGAALYEETIKGIPVISEGCKKHGMTLLYHNHDFEFAKTKEISADAEIFILTSPGYFLSDEISCVKAKALKRCLRQP